MSNNPNDLLQRLKQLDVIDLIDLLSLDSDDIAEKFESLIIDSHDYIKEKLHEEDIEERSDDQRWSE